MLSLLLDEHVSARVAVQLRRHRDRVRIHTVREWHDGRYLGASDNDLLEAAVAERLTLVTYDKRTIAPLLKERAARGDDHGGVIFVDGVTISPSDVGGLVRSLLQVGDTSSTEDWHGRILYLER